jgi:hypothetical protein
MPLATAMPVLQTQLQPLFDAAPASSAEAGTRLARAYGTYCLAGGVAVLPPRQDALGNALAAAFDPVAGSGASGLVLALVAFWPGTPVPGMAPTAQAVVFTPTGDLSLVIPGAAELKPAAQAAGLAAILHALTLASVKVVIPPSPTLIPIA